MYGGVTASMRSNDAEQTGKNLLGRSKLKSAEKRGQLGTAPGARARVALVISALGMNRSPRAGGSDKGGASKLPRYESVR